MKRTFLYSLVLLGFSTLLIQCVATQKDMDYANVQMRKVDSKVENIDKEVNELKKQTVQEVRERQAETGDRLDYHQSEILKLHGEIEEINLLIRQVQAENKELKKLLLSRLDTVEQNRSEETNRLTERLTLTEDQLLKAHERLDFTGNEIKSLKDARSEEASKQAMEAAQRAREAEKKAQLAAEKEAAEREKNTPKNPKDILPEPHKVDVSSQNITESAAEEKEEKVEKVEKEEKVEKVEKVVSEPVEKTPPPSPVSTTSTSYDQGMALFKQKKYRDAYNSFAEYLDKNPTGSEAVNARYYAAQSLYEDKDYELSILEFQKVIVEHPQSDLAPKALYKQGASFENIGDPETARIVYNKLVDSYPKSAEVASAKTRLEALKK